MLLVRWDERRKNKTTENTEKNPGLDRKTIFKFPQLRALRVLRGFKCPYPKLFCKIFLLERSIIVAARFAANFKRKKL